MHLRRLSLLALILSILGIGLARAQQELDTVKPHLRILKQGSTKIYLLGTIHGAHARNPYYSWPQLERIVQLISPDLLCVEIRPEHFNAEESYSDGPIEMPFLVDLAFKSDIPCRPIDWWLDEWLKDMSKADWNGRDDRMTDCLMKTVKENGAKRTLVTVGAGHIEPFVSRLVKQGWVQEEPPKLNLMIEHFQDVPKSVLALWENGVRYLSSLPTASTDRSKQKIETWKGIIQSQGYLFARSK